MTFEMLLNHPWFDTGLAASVAGTLALLLHKIASALLLRATSQAPVLHAMLDKLRPAARWALPLAALQVVWHGAPDTLGRIGALRHINGVLLIVAATWLTVRAISGFVEGVVAQHPADALDNLRSRRVLTQTRVLARCAKTVLVLAGSAMVLMTFPGARQVGASLLASAGVIGIVAGLAAKPVFSNLIAGVQIALAQPIRIDDVLVVEGEWGRVEEITGTFVVLRIWDDRRLVLPLAYFIEKPFQNWTRQSAQLLGSVFLHVDYGMPLAPLRAELERVVRAAPEWDGRFFNLQVTEASERSMQLRALCTASSSSQAFDLRCRVREALIEFMQREYPQHLPRLRVEQADLSTGQSDPTRPATPLSTPEGAGSSDRRGA